MKHPHSKILASAQKIAGNTHQQGDDKN